MGGLREIPGFLGTGGNLLVDLTLVIEILFYISLCLGVTAQLRKQYKWHDRFQIPVVVLNLFFIVFVMIPTIMAIISTGVASMPPLVLAHAGVGVLAQLVAVYCLLAGLKILPRKIGVLRWFMWTAFVLWTITLLLGIGLYISFYTGGDSSGGAVTEHAAELPAEHAADASTEPAAPVETVAEHAAEPVTAEPTEAPVEVVEEHAEEPVEVVEEHAAEPVEVVEEHAEEPVEVAAEPTATPAPPTPTPAPVRAGLLTVSDDQIHGDKATLALTGVVAPPDGSVYEAWLEGEGQAPLSLGKLTLSGDAINHTFTDPAGRNLLALFNRAFVSVEPASDSAPAPSGVNAFEGEISTTVLEPILPVVASAPDTPDGDGYTLNALNQVLKIEPEVGFQKDYSIPNNDLAALKIQAEGILNILEGQSSPDYGDRDGNGEVYSQGDGFGLLGSGSGAGYLQAIANQAAAAAQVEGASPETVRQAEQTQAAAANAISLAEQIRDLELQILQAGDIASVGDLVNQVVSLTQALTDADGLDLADPGQGGMRTVYILSQLMASVELFPVAGEIAAPAPAPTPELIDEHAGDTASEHDGN
ncbi:MAG: anti-sigma factor [Anaerolineales bacterium]|nr:anti-sigma factor [Anaerolineales bacterium]